MANLFGTPGIDLLNGTALADFIFGGDSNDLLNGDAGTDFLAGEAGDDSLLGGLDSDLLIGGLGSDFLNGGDQDDTLVGEDGIDFIATGPGTDRILITSRAPGNTDIITDFTTGVDDIVIQQGRFGAAATTQFQFLNNNRLIFTGDPAGPVDVAFINVPFNIATDLVIEA